MPALHFKSSATSLKILGELVFINFSLSSLYRQSTRRQKRNIVEVCLRDFSTGFFLLTSSTLKGVGVFLLVNFIFGFDFHVWVFESFIFW